MPSAAEEDFTEQPIFWFATLEEAIEEGDFAAAAAAVRELRRLGIEVQYLRHRRTQQPATVGC